MQMPVFLILFFAPVYVPLDLLEGWIAGVATVNPVTYLLETGRGFVAGDAPHIAGAFAIAIGLGLLLSGLPRSADVPRRCRNAEKPRGAKRRLQGSRGRDPCDRSRPAEHAQERVDHLRVELRSRGFDEPPLRLVLAQRLAVRAVGRHRVEGVAGEDDPRLERDLLAGEVVGIAGAVVVLVRAADDEPHLAELLDGGEDALAEDRVGLDDRALLRSERAWLREDP